MRHVAALLLALVGFGGYAVAQSLPAAAVAEAHATLLSIDGNIDPISAGYLSRGIDAATEDGSQFVILLLDTPGGLLDSTKDMVAKILASSIPVVVYVAPPGAQAASAGTFITAAAHVAAMAPSTNLGAAALVGPGGEELPETIKSKATQNAAAYIRSIADERGRNSDALERTVLSAASYTATEALESDIIDIVAADVEELLGKLDGMAVELAAGEVVLKTQDLALRIINRNPVERFLGFLADPNVAFLLLSLGGMGILIEFLSPGLIFPGVGGVIALALAFVAVGNLPVNWVGVGLIIFAIVLFFFEFQAPGIGIFGVGGAISFILGGFLLFGGLEAPAIPTPGIRVNIWLVGGAATLMFGLMTFLVREMRAARQTGSTGSTTAPTLVGQVAVASTDLAPRGTVRVAGEYWSAVSDSGEALREGAEVEIVDVEGLVVRVRPRPEAEGGETP